MPLNKETKQMHILTQIHTLMPIDIFVHHANTFTRLQTLKNAHTCTHTNILTHTLTHTRASTDPNAHIYTYSHTCVHNTRSYTK